MSKSNKNIFLLEIEDEKTEFVLELLQYFKFVKVKSLTKQDVKLVKSLKRSFAELKLIQEGKLKARDIKDLLNELWDYIFSKWPILTYSGQLLLKAYLKNFFEIFSKSDSTQIYLPTTFSSKNQSIPWLDLNSIV